MRRPLGSPLAHVIYMRHRESRSQAARTLPSSLSAYDRNFHLEQPSRPRPSRSWRVIDLAQRIPAKESVMTAQFWPCPGYSRHVKRGDATCPFCGATASVEPGPTRVLAGRLSRAALFAAGAVGAAFANTDCTAPNPYGGGPPPGAVEIFPNGTEDSSASDAPSEAAPDSTDASTTPPTDAASADDVPVSSEPPYGSPPFGSPIIPDE